MSVASGREIWAVIAIALVACGCSTSPGTGPGTGSSACRRSLSDDEVAAIADPYLKYIPGGQEKQVRIKRQGCDYIYTAFSGSPPTRNGDWFGMTVSEDGKVIDFSFSY